MTGSQDPRVRVEPVRISSDGELAAELMAAYAYRLDPWQRTVVDCWLGRDELGEYNVTSAGLAVPRQNVSPSCRTKSAVTSSPQLSMSALPFSLQ